MTAGALPDVKRCSPISVTGEAPILNVLKPVAKSSLTDILGNPVYSIVVLNKVFTNLGHLDKPSVASVVDKRSITSPAMRIIVLKLGRGEELALFVEVCDNHRVSLLNEDACVWSLGSHLTLAVNELNERKTVSSADLVIVLTECGSDMNDTRTVGHGNVVVSGDVMSLLALLRSRLSGAAPESLVASALKLDTLHFLKDFVCGGALLALKRAENGVKKCLCHIIGIAVNSLNLAIGVRGVYAKGNVRGESPGSCCPSEEVCVLVGALKANNSRTLLYSLIALRNLVAGKRSTTTGAVRNDFEALIEQSLVPNLLKRPPFRLDKVVGVGNVGVIHVSPEANCAGEVLPHFLVIPYGLLTMSNERLKSVCFYLVLAVNAELLLNLKLNGQTVSIPTSLTKNSSALHGLVSGNHILNNSGQNVTDVRLTVCGRRAVEEGVIFTTLADVNALTEDVVFLPESTRLLFSLNEIQIRRDLFVDFHAFYLQKFIIINKISPDGINHRGE